MPNPLSRWLCGLLLVLAGNASAQSPVAQLDLLGAYQLAEQQNPALAAARETRRARLEEVPKARSQLFPQVRVSANAFYNYQDISIDETSAMEGSPFGSFGGEQEYNTANLSLAVTQAIYRREAFIALKQAHTVEQLADLEFELARQELALNLAEAYFGALEAGDAVRTFEAQLRAVERERARAERRRELGVGAVLSVNDTRARLASTQAGLLQARSQLRLAENAVRRLVQTPFAAVAPLTDAFQPSPPQPDQPQPWMETAERQSRQVRLAELDLEVAGASLAAAKAQRHPRVDLVANLQRDYQGGNPTLGGIGLETDGAAVGVQVSMPLFEGGSVSADVRQRGAERAASRYQLLDTRQAAALAAESAFITLQSAIEQIGALETALEAAITAEQASERGLELGQRTTLELLDVQRERYEVERTLATARYQYLLAYLQLRITVGDPVEEVVREMNRWLRAD